jgi:hypothetical protein
MFSLVVGNWQQEAQLSLPQQPFANHQMRQKHAYQQTL